MNAHNTIQSLNKIDIRHILVHPTPRSTSDVNLRGFSKQLTHTKEFRYRSIELRLCTKLNTVPRKILFRIFFSHLHAPLARRQKKLLSRTTVVVVTTLTSYCHFSQNLK